MTRTAGLQERSGGNAPAPECCVGCTHRANNPDGGWCYMFERAPATSTCAQRRVAEPGGSLARAAAGADRDAE